MNNVDLRLPMEVANGADVGVKVDWLVKWFHEKDCSASWCSVYVACCRVAISRYNQLTGTREVESITYAHSAASDPVVATRAAIQNAICDGVTQTDLVGKFSAIAQYVLSQIGTG